jgi:hypothetical protein
VIEFPLSEGGKEGGRKGGMEREDLLEAGDFGGGQQAEAQWAFVVHGADDLYGGAAVLGGHDNIPEGGRGGGRRHECTRNE